MAQYSMPWADGAGDGGPYSAEAWDDIFEVLFTTQNAATEGVVKGYKGELAVTGTASPVTVAAGAALIKGKFYVNSDAVQVSVPTPTGSTRYDRIVLQADYSARTVRIVRLEGSEGGSAPSLTQTDGTKWEIPLAQLEVHTDGSLVVTDQRAFAHIGTMISPEQIEDGSGSGLDADKLDGHDASYFLPATGKAADADKLDGHDSSYFLPATAQAADSAKLGGVEASKFPQVMAYGHYGGRSWNYHNVSSNYDVTSITLPPGTYLVVQSFKDNVGGCSAPAYIKWYNNGQVIYGGKGGQVNSQVFTLTSETTIDLHYYVYIGNANDCDGKLSVEWWNYWVIKLA